MNQYSDIPRIAAHIAQKYQPQKLWLFGSCARRAVRKNSDIDLCLVVDTANKRALRAALTQELLSLTEYDVDIVIMTPQEWEQDAPRASTLAGLIQRKGVLLYG